MTHETPQSLVVRTSSYIDSVEFHQTRYFGRELLQKASDQCGSMVVKEVPTYDSRVIQSLWVNQPEQEFLRYVHSHGLSIRIVRVHIALDLITRSKADARRLQDFFVRHLLPFSRPNEDVSWNGSTSYFGFESARQGGSSVAIYSDYPSKLDDASPCCHVEWRPARTKALQNFKAQSPALLLGLDHRDFWAKAAKLVQTPSHDAVAALWLRAFTSRSNTAGRTFPFRWPDAAGRWVPNRDASARRVASYFLRPLWDEDGEIRSNNDLAAFLIRRRRSFRGRSTASLFKPLDNSWLLPPRQNGLWAGLPMKSST